MKKNFIALSLMAIGFWGIAQTNIADSLYHSAKDKAVAKEYTQAKRDLQVAILQNPKNSDFSLLFGQIYSWQQQWDSARYWLNSAHNISPKYRDIRLAQLNVELWSNQKEAYLAILNTALQEFPNDSELMFQKAKWHLDANQEEEAVNMLIQLLELYPSDVQASNLLLSIKKSGMTHRIMGEYNFYFFEEPHLNRWHFFSLMYQQRTKIGSVVAKINSADYLSNNDLLFATNSGVQYELEAYPRVTSRDYLYLNYGYSPSRIFSKNRAGFEWFHAFKNKFESSAGLRYLNFTKNASNNSDVWIYTGSVSKYYKNYLFSLRGYFSNNQSGWSKSYFLQARRYFNNPLNYVYVMASLGVSPDSQTTTMLFQSPDILNSQSIKVGHQQMISSRWFVQTDFGIRFQEYVASKVRNEYEFQFKLGWFF